MRHIVIVGGGAFGLSTAYFLGKRLALSATTRVTLIEKDASLARSSTQRSAASIREQFSLRENVLMSQFGSRFFQSEVLSEFQHVPYLFLAVNDSQAQVLRENHQVQKESGGKAVLVEKRALCSLFPTMNFDDVVLASLGAASVEGHVDPALYCQTLKNQAKGHGVTCVQGEATGFRKNASGSVSHVEVAGRIEIPVDDLVICAGAWTRNVIQKMAGPLDRCPVFGRRRVVYSIRSRAGTSRNHQVMMIEPDGVYFRPERNGGTYICGRSPGEGEPDPDFSDLDSVDIDVRTEEDELYFREKIWPTLAHRVKDFEELKVLYSWSGFYEYNVLDQNLVIGKLKGSPLTNCLFACGSSGHGLQHSPAIGRAISELLLDGGYRTIDLSRLDINRESGPILERNIV